MLLFRTMTHLNKIYIEEIKSNHEEAYTKKIVHLNHLAKRGVDSVNIYFPDTDAF